MTPGQAQPSDRTTRWLSREFAELLADPQKCRPQPALEPAYDLVIVGSGYGGAIAAAELAGSSENGRPLRICVLERGREYLPGAFPSQLSELPTQLRGSFGGKTKGGEGLFDIRGGRDIGLLVANGLGGGSLINAGVMETPRQEVFDRRWPPALRDRTALEPYYAEAKALLGAAHDGVDNRIDGHVQLRGEPLAKTRVLGIMGRSAFREAAITVALSDRRNAEGVELKACKLCGDCATGCNYGAKESLDTNLLVRAARRGTDIWCGATVLRLQRPAPGVDAWSLELVHTDEKLRLQDAGPRWLTARRVILAAGALGSSEILLRTNRREAGLSFSPLLGQRFSGNGDLIAFGYDYGPQGQANAVADEDQPPQQRRVGPTITGVIDATVDAAPGLAAQRIVVEELAVPGSLRRAAEEAITTANTLHELGCFDDRPHQDGHPADDPYAVHRERIRHMSVFAAMGDDGADGSLCLEGEVESQQGDGHVAVVWPGLPQRPLFDAQLRKIDSMRSAAGFGGRTIPNPLWRFLPESMAFLVQNERGPLASVHPLGGCPMGDSAAQGVVDDCGRVFDPARAGAEQPWHQGLVVLDGAILPSALATNPALTIAAVALRAVRLLRQDWGWTAAAPDLPVPVQRPQLMDVEQAIIARAAEPRPATMIGVSERLAGPVDLRDAQGQLRQCWVELTLGYAPLALERLFRPDAQGRLSAAQLTVGEGSEATLRVFALADWRRLQCLTLSLEERQREEARVARSYRVTGTLTVMEREATGVARRTARGAWAWLRNRGLRDSTQGLIEWAHKAAAGDRSDGPGPVERVRGMLQLASHAGERRRFDYRLRIVEQLPCEPGATAFDAPAGFVGGDIRGHKHISYGRPSNPWRQLQELSLSELAGPLEGPRLLSLDPQYLAARGRPLMRIESQRDHIEALADFVSLAGYFSRMLLTIHIWNLRKPDKVKHREVQRLPGKLPGLPAPEIHWIELGEADGSPLRLRLARYRRDPRATPAASGPVPAPAPVLLIHGYSASGTSYAHPALRPSLAACLADCGRDVWVADLRSSAGFPSACLPWSFEQVALNDIPAAVDYIWWRSGQQPLDVVAHCMGAVMFSQAVLSAGKTPQEITRLLRPRASSTDCGPDRYAVQRKALPGRLRRVVLSQNGPVMVMSQQNIFRGYVMSYLEQMFGPLRYAFRPEPGEGLGMELLDRFLGSLPYPDEELLLENPWQPWKRTEHLATRHRMDAIYGRTFSLGALSPEVLEHIDDLFGPLNLDTVAQVIHFSQQQTITDRSGRNRFVSRDSLQAHWNFKTLALHGQDNGLSDVATAYRAEAVLLGAGCHVERRVMPHMGHQDSLIGRDAAQTCAVIRDFLDAPPDHPRFRQHQAPRVYTAEVPWLGPMLNRQEDGSLLLGIGASPQLGRPEALCLLPVERDAEGRWCYEALMQGLGLGPEDTLWRPGDTDTDWFARPLPDWARDGRVRRLLVLPVYPQPACMSLRGFDPGDSNAAQRLWRRHASQLPRATDSAMAAAIERAVDGINRNPGASPPGLLRLPGPAPAGLRLALGSCLYPPGILNERPAYRAWDLLNQRLDRRERDPLRPDLLVLTGDQIYADATAGMFDPTLADDRYRKPYETWLRNRSVRRVLGRVPLLTLPDDHELDDNWAPLPAEASDAARARNRELQERGLRAFLRYQRLQWTATAEETLAQPLWRALEVQGVPLFLLDTRSRRSGRGPGSEQSLLGQAQWQALRTWLLAQPQDCPKLIVSPSVLLPRHRYAMPARLAFGQEDRSNRASCRSDGWDGYPGDLFTLLDLIGASGLRGLVFLSGDEHLGLFTRARLRRPDGSGEVLLHSIHSAGLNTPYRFANADPAELALQETLRFQGASGEWECEVDSQVFEGAGFTLLSLQRQADEGWRLHCRFDTDEPAAMPRERGVDVVLDL
ncbi:hypothetical protein D0B54_10960 [Solimonas sp. K1W22B-7]|uniref:alkaline phosphatase D family protein n=1 Tax=Solimonas sp. K1W22B-7 TaxID=2303331 RepID=UPI000E335C09|nr:alkaline phosphatase D family protein [Solimonas sp. K1W22B-7]AXQ29174.1 hypothetical protein D0B54_10960 [Solimonas sp. K1W22B-7]